MVVKESIDDWMSPMLALLFAVGSTRFALAASKIVEVLPLVALKPVPAMPAEVAGLLNYRGTVVPVIDMSSVMFGKPCLELFSSRIVVTRYPLPDGRPRLLGLRVERASETVRVDGDGLRSSELRTASWLGKITVRDGEFVQLIDPPAMLSDPLRATLFPVEDGDDAVDAHEDPASD